MQKKVVFRDRIKELRRVPANTLIANPKNWRTHSDQQKKILGQLLEEVGYAEALIAGENQEGKLVLIDGHLRADMTSDQTVPVLILDVTEEEADKLLILLDPISSMAGRDDRMLQQIIDETDIENETLNEFINSIIVENNQCLESIHEKQHKLIPESYQVVVECDDENDQKIFYEEMIKRGRKCRLLNM